MNKTTQVKYPLKEYYSQIFRSYDLVNRLFTFGMDKRWRKDTAKLCLSYDPEIVIDLCCGTGDIAIKIAELAGRDLEIKGYDFNRDMLDSAENKVSKTKFKNIDFIQGEASNIPFKDKQFDCMTIAFGFRNLCYKNPEQEKHMLEMNRVLKNGGRLLILESGIPSNSIIKFLYRLHLHVILIPLGGLLSGNWKAYKYLAESAENFYSIEEIKELLVKFGFEMIHVKKFFFGAANLVVAKKLDE